MKQTLIASIVLLSLAAAPATQPEIRHGQPMAGSPPERSRRYFQNLAQEAEPTGHAEPLRLPSYLATLRHDLVHDPRLVAFSPVADLQPDGSVLLRGFAEYPELKTTAGKFLEAVGFPRVDNQIALLPNLDTPGAVVVAAKTFLYSKPAAPHETLTQVLCGDAVFLLARDGDTYLCHSSDGYLGYVSAADVKPLDADALEETLDAPKVTITRDVRASLTFLPAGVRLPVAGAFAGGIAVSLPAGTLLNLESGRYTIDTGASVRIEKIIQAAQAMIGTPYVWGGRTSEGVDCSGLVGTAFQSQGITLPRDADEQALCGTLVATRAVRGPLRRGDLLFFMSNRGSIHHVALYLGNDKFLEATSPGVKVSSFNPKDKEFAPKRDESFGFAKRVLQ